MSQVSVTVHKAASRNATVKALRPVLGLSLRAMLTAIEAQSPLLEVELYTNDFAVVADTLRALMGTLDTLGDDYSMLEDGEEISPEILLNILEGSETYRL
jgi:hypothetical protein